MNNIIRALKGLVNFVLHPRVKTVRFEGFHCLTLTRKKILADVIRQLSLFGDARGGDSPPHVGNKLDSLVQISELLLLSNCKHSYFCVRSNIRVMTHLGTYERRPRDGAKQ